MKKAVKAYNHVSTTSEFKELSRLRLKARCKEAFALANARHEKATEIAKSLKSSGMNADDIAKHTKLTVDEILKL